MSVTAASLRSPLDAQVDAIIASPQYVGEAAARRLIDTLRRSHPRLFDAEKKTGQIDTREMIRRAVNALQETITRMNAAGFGDDGSVDTASLKRVVDSNDKMVKLLSRLQGELKANDRQQALEEAVVEALEAAANPQFREAYLSRFHKKLAEKSRKLRETE